MIELIFNRCFRGWLVYDHNCYDADKKIFTLEICDFLPILNVAIFNLELKNIGVELVGILYDTSIDL